eukprot:TRINITY_DN12591_c0_g1_i1.p1 TRINITY_DN12591_c0_g1~~TRINITY_DN12591_c0_g1_i1.p1  ORF type:complete len:525 (+),score=140.91 TRINITY_DN12591_c0_g1_i1:284-1858(+)
MVVLAASIISKTGKALVSRQFVDMSRIRIEGLLAAFPKLVGSGKQHTYVETENVRYVYQPMEALYLLLVTNKQSNILEDLETLRLLSKLVPEYVPGLDEEGISAKAFELIFAFDECISMGFKENVTIAQVKQFTEMESHEEKLHKMIIQSKINDTKDVMKRKAIEIDKSKDTRKGGMERGGMSSLSGMGSGPMAMDNNGFSSGSSGNFGSSGGFGPGSMDRQEAVMNKGRGGAASGVPKMGMQLGKIQKTNQFLESLKAEGEVIVEEPSVAAASAGLKSVALSMDPITITTEERLVVALKKDGGLENLEVQGTMALEIQKEDDAYIRVQIETGPNRNFQFKTHPNIDKNLHANESILGLKDPNRPFPAGSPLGILKWRMQTKDETLVPLNINCWPSVSGGESFVNIEYEASKLFDLQHVAISIPLPAIRDPPSVNQVDGDWSYDARRSTLEWTIDLIDNTNRNGSMEFVVPAADPAIFFPIDVKFSATKTYCDVKINAVVSAAGGEPVKYTGRTQLVVESYQVV